MPAASIVERYKLVAVTFSLLVSTILVSFLMILRMSQGMEPSRWALAGLGLSLFASLVITSFIASGHSRQSGLGRYERDLASLLEEGYAEMVEVSPHQLPITDGGGPDNAAEAEAKVEAAEAREEAANKRVKQLEARAFRVERQSLELAVEFDKERVGLDGRRVKYEIGAVATLLLVLAISTGILFGLDKEDSVRQLLSTDVPKLLISVPIALLSQHLFAQAKVMRDEALLAARVAVRLRSFLTFSEMVDRDGARSDLLVRFADQVFIETLRSGSAVSAEASSPASDGSG